MKNLYLIDLHCKNWVDWISTTWDKFYNLKNVNFQKKGVKVKKITILRFMTTFHNFILRIETDWATKVVKLILKIRNAIYRC